MQKDYRKTPIVTSCQAKGNKCGLMALNVCSNVYCKMDSCDTHNSPVCFGCQVCSACQVSLVDENLPPNRIGFKANYQPLCNQCFNHPESRGPPVEKPKLSATKGMMMKYCSEAICPTAEKKLEVYFNHLDKDQPEAHPEAPFSQTNLEASPAPKTVREVNLLSSKEMDDYVSELDEGKKAALDLVTATMKGFNQLIVQVHRMEEEQNKAREDPNHVYNSPKAEDFYATTLMNVVQTQEGIKQLMQGDPPTPLETGQQDSEGSDQPKLSLIHI